ncbi:MAG: hypothetical protein RI907_3401 [Pseudomonadota bacterium]|jgi:HD-like signal output (HDOD) protein
MVTATLDASAESPSAISEFTSSVIDVLDQVRKTAPFQTIVFPPYPALLARLQTAMAEAEPDLNEVARIATSDVSMSMALIKSANSPLYAAGQPVQTIGQALNRLGLNHTASVMTGFLAQRAIRINSPHLARFWERASKRAVAMAFMARKLTGMSDDLAYTYGLFCHAGIPVMMQSCKGYAGTMAEGLARTDRSFIATENANHRTDHAVVGALVGRLWRIHPHVVAAIRLHHDLEGLGGNRIDTDVQNLMAAGLVAEHLMMESEGQPSDKDWTAHSEAALSWLQVQAEELVGWQVELNDLYDVL